MRSSFFFLLFFLCKLASGQDTGSMHQQFAEVYLVKDTSVKLIIYNQVDGTAIDTLLNSADKYCWYLLEIKNSVDGWFQIQHIAHIPGCDSDSLQFDDLSIQNYWVKAENFMVDTQGYHEVTFYSLKNSTADIVFQTSNFFHCNVLEANGGWLKVSLIIDDEEIVGWLGPGDYCAFPWTTCP